jgi:DNA polymerase-3 subunit beta
MKISVTQEQVAKALNHILKATAAKPNIPVLANVLISARKGRISFSATDLDVSVTATIGGDVAEEGELTVNARLLTEFINQLNSNRVELLQTGQTLEVKSVDNHAQLYIITAEDFPNLPSTEDKADLVVNAEELRVAILKTTVACAVDQSRPILTGVHLESSPKKLSLVGVDGFRLAKKMVALSKAPGREVEVTVPARSLLELSKIISDEATEKDEVEIHLLSDKNQVLFTVGDVTLSSRLLEGEYPDYKQIIPTESNFGFSATKQTLSKSVKIATIFSRNVIGNKTFFKINPDEKALVLSAKVEDMGNNESQAELIETTGESFETAFNGKFLSDMLSSMQGDTISFEANGITAPGVFKDSEDEDYLHIIMPMRIE